MLLKCYLKTNVPTPIPNQIVVSSTKFYRNVEETWNHVSLNSLSPWYVYHSIRVSKRHYSNSFRYGKFSLMKSHQNVKGTPIVVLLITICLLDVAPLEYRRDHILGLVDIFMSPRKLPSCRSSKCQREFKTTPFDIDLSLWCQILTVHWNVKGITKQLPLTL